MPKILVASVVEVELKPRQSMQIRVPFSAADVINPPLASSSQLLLLLVPVALNYHCLNCQFSEQLVRTNAAVSLTSLIPKSLRFLQFVPLMSVHEKRCAVDSVGSSSAIMEN
jgi:hypothetical protein